MDLNALDHEKAVKHMQRDFREGIAKINLSYKEEIQKLDQTNKALKNMRVIES